MVDESKVCLTCCLCLVKTASRFRSDRIWLSCKRLKQALLCTILYQVELRNFPERCGNILFVTLSVIDVLINSRFRRLIPWRRRFHHLSSFMDEKSLNNHYHRRLVFPNLRGRSFVFIVLSFLRPPFRFFIGSIHIQSNESEGKSAGINPQNDD